MNFMYSNTTNIQQILTSCHILDAAVVHYNPPLQLFGMQRQAVNLLRHEIDKPDMAINLMLQENDIILSCNLPLANTGPEMHSAACH
jgi:hypothetical protein